MLYVILGAILFLVFLLGYHYFGSPKKSAILITGLCDSGKTSLLMMLVHKKTPLTFTSLAPNVEEYRLKSMKKLSICDVPGLEKLRFECINRQRINTIGIIFVIDSTVIQNTLKDAAEYLFYLLTDGILARSRIPFLILCNKNDLPDAKDAVSIEKMLEVELTTLCHTKANALADLDGHQECRVPLVNEANVPFSFAKCKHHRVTFADCSVISADISPVRLWLERL